MLLFEKEPFRTYVLATIGCTIGEVIYLLTHLIQPTHTFHPLQILIGISFIIGGIVSGWALVLLNYNYYSTKEKGVV